MKQQILTGGLMRCCLLTFDQYEGEPEPGAVVPCRYCSSSMLVEQREKPGGPVLVWRWNHP